MVLIEVLAKTSKILKAYELKKALEPGYGNIIDLMARSHLENAHSRVISFLLDQKETHHHLAFGKLFLNHLRSLKLLENKIVGTMIDTVYREWGTADYRRIDMLIRTDGNEFIIIENKVYADDQPKQLHDYIIAVKEKFSITPIVVYLTLFPKVPTEKSIKKAELDELILQNRFVNITYADFILPWIKDCIEQTKYNEEILKSALIQYRDAIEGITRQRSIDKMSNTEIIKEITKDSETIASFFALRLVSNREIAKHLVETQCCDALNSIASEHGLKFSIGSEGDDKDCFADDWGFDFTNPDTDLVISFPFGENLSGLWYGFFNKNVSPNFEIILKEHGFKFHAPFWYREMVSYRNWLDDDVLAELCNGQQNKVIQEIEARIVELLNLVKESEKK